jgi:O-antigen/teichoic acid export membrane protein
MLKQLHQFRRWAGVDRAVFYTNAAQVLRLVTGPISMVLVLRYLTPEIQGYFYAFAGVVGTQVFLEMGFSQNILQFASHEYAKLRFSEKQRLEGDEEAYSRLISLGRLAFGYYAIAAFAFFILVGVGGHLFFSHAGQHNVAWQKAWWMVVASAAGSLAINPARALLEGCNQIAVIAKFTIVNSLAGFVVSAISLVAGMGIYVTAITAATGFLLSLGYYVLYWRRFFVHFFSPPRHGRISWYREIWPFQWRIAVSWMSGYFIFDIINPIVFYFCGPVEAGRFGMSLQLVRSVFNVATSWVGTKAPRFGMLIAMHAWRELDSLWRRSMIQSFMVCLLGVVCFWVAVPWAGLYFPKVSTRLAPLGTNLWLGGAMLVQIFINSMAMELRAHKREPYMWLSVANAVFSILFILPLVRWWGIYGAAMGYALAIWVVLLPAYKIYRVKHTAYRLDSGPDTAGIMPARKIATGVEPCP